MIPTQWIQIATRTAAYSGRGSRNDVDSCHMARS